MKGITECCRMPIIKSSMVVAVLLASRLIRTSTNDCTIRARVALPVIIARAMAQSLIVLPRNIPSKKEFIRIAIKIQSGNAKIKYMHVPVIK